MEKKIEKIYELFDIIIPNKYDIDKNDYKFLIRKTSENPKEVISEEIISNGFYGINDYNDPNFITLVALDILSEGFVSIINSNFDDNLWRRLSSLLIYNDAEELRPKLTDEIYVKEQKYTYKNSNMIFEGTEFNLILIKILELEALGLVKKNNYEKLENVCLSLNIEIESY